MNNLAKAYEEYEWWIRACYIQPTQKDCDYIFQKAGWTYNREIAESLWWEKGDEYCNRLRCCLNTRKRSLIEFAQSFSGVPGDLDIPEAMNQMLKEYEGLHVDIMNFHALGWHPQPPDLPTTWVEDSTAELKTFYEASIGLTVGNGSTNGPVPYSEWVQTYKRKWWAQEWQEVEPVVAKSNIDHEIV